MINTNLLVHAEWRKSSFSGSGGTGGGNCIEVAALSDGTIAIRDSNDSRGGTLFFTHSEMQAWIKSCKAGEFET